MKIVKNTTGEIMSQKCKLLPGDDASEFVLNFNEEDFDVMVELERNYKGEFGFVFFKKPKKLKLSFSQRIKKWLRKILNISK